MQVKQYIEGGVKHCKEIAPEGWVAIEEHEPSYSVVPWDYHGRKHFEPLLYILKKIGIETILAEHSRERTWAIGTGPNGRPRSGDYMMPGIYTLYVRNGSEEKALSVIKTHREEVSNWLASYGKPNEMPMPEALRN